MCICYSYTMGTRGIFEENARVPRAQPKGLGRFSDIPHSNHGINSKRSDRSI